MKYHFWIVLADGKNLIKVNGGIDWIKPNIIIPIFNGQTVLFEYYRKQFVINTGSISRLYIFKTKEVIELKTEIEFVQLFESDEFNANNCTEEILNQVRKDLSSNNTKSLLEKSFSAIENQVFVIMKFGDDGLDSAYEGVIEPIIKEFNLTPIRVDKIQDSGKINDQILENIAKSKFIISDLSGERPNCYYETGFAHALGKELVLTIQEKEKIHFDLAGYRFITWKTEAEFRRKLKKRIKIIIDK